MMSKQESLYLHEEIMLLALRDEEGTIVTSTVQYALGFQDDEDGWWKKRLTEGDLKVDSPYNTYKNPGLPPVPICNPGLDSLNAALNPTETEYWYYVSDSDGRMHFAKTIRSITRMW